LEVVDLVLLGCLLRATSEKKVVNFFQEKKCTPDKILQLRLCQNGILNLLTSNYRTPPYTYGQRWYRPLSLCYSNGSVFVTIQRDRDM